MNAPKSFKKNGFTYNLIKEKTPFTIYEQRNKEGVSLGFETIILRERRERNINGSIIRAGVWLPANEDFGRRAWSYQKRENAEKKYEELILKANEVRDTMDAKKGDETDETNCETIQRTREY